MLEWKVGNNRLSFVSFVETASPSSGGENTLPVTFDATEDPNLTNLTRNDANCDKTGTCYDGKINESVH